MLLNDSVTFVLGHISRIIPITLLNDSVTFVLGHISLITPIMLLNDSVKFVRGHINYSSTYTQMCAAVCALCSIMTAFLACHLAVYLMHVCHLLGTLIWSRICLLYDAPKYTGSAIFMATHILSSFLIKKQQN